MKNELEKINLSEEEIKQIADEFLKLEKSNKIMLEQLIEKIEFDKEKNIRIKLTFENIVN